MKSYTDLEQSKKLAGILPIESADMRYAPFGDTHPWVWDDNILERDAIPCWSLAALIELMPSEIKGHDLAMYKSYCYNDRKFVYSVYYEGEFIDYEQSILFSTFSMEFIDACYEMILKLNELNLL